MKPNYDLKALAGERWRVIRDPAAGDDPGWTQDPWLWRIEGQGGHVYVHGADVIGVWVKGSRTRDRILALPGARLHQAGDREWTVVLPVDHLDTVCEIIYARRRRQVSEEERARLAVMSAIHSPLRKRIPGSQFSGAPCDFGTETDLDVDLE